MSNGLRTTVTSIAAISNASASTSRAAAVQSTMGMAQVCGSRFSVWSSDQLVVRPGRK